MPFLSSTRGAAGQTVPASDGAISAAKTAAREYLERLCLDPEAQAE